METEKTLVLDVNENPKRLRDWILFAIQHILAMLVACITVPIITGLPIAPTLIAAGIGTISYILITKQKSPVFLSSSFAYLQPMLSALAVGEISAAGGHNYLALIIGMFLVGFIYCVVGLFIKLVGTRWLNKVLPPIVIGPIIMVIGLSLSSSAVSNLTSATGSGQPYNLVALLCGIVALIVTALTSHYGKKMMRLIPFVIGMLSGYLTAVVFTVFGYHLGGIEYLHIVNFEPLISIFRAKNFGVASFFNYKLFIPNNEESFIFLQFDAIKEFNWRDIGTVILLFVPASLVTICEHVGDHENLGKIINKDLLNGEPGMTRTLIGDGVATALSGALCGAANTTYGENVAVIGMTKIASVKVVLLAAIMTIVIGFISPFTALLSTIPGCVTGGVSLILYGFIASSGVKLLIKEKIDFTKTKNIFVCSVILVVGIGGLTLSLFGGRILITAIAVAMILGIILKLILFEEKPNELSEKQEPICECETCSCEQKIEETVEEKEGETPVEEKVEAKEVKKTSTTKKSSSTKKPSTGTRKKKTE